MGPRERGGEVPHNEEHIEDQLDKVDERTFIGFELGWRGVLCSEVGGCGSHRCRARGGFLTLGVSFSSGRGRRGGAGQGEGAGAVGMPCGVEHTSKQMLTGTANTLYRMSTSIRMSHENPAMERRPDQLASITSPMRGRWQSTICCHQQQVYQPGHHSRYFPAWRGCNLRNVELGSKVYLEAFASRSSCSLSPPNCELRVLL